MRLEKNISLQYVHTLKMHGLSEYEQKSSTPFKLIIRWFYIVLHNLI